MTHPLQHTPINDGAAESDQPPALEARRLTWTALIGYWATFAKASLSLPKDATGQAMRRCVPEIIGLQAVCMALSELNELDPVEQALGLDRAAVLINRHASAVIRAWPDDAPPKALRELIDDARDAWRQAAARGPRLNRSDSG